MTISTAQPHRLPQSGPEGGWTQPTLEKRLLRRVAKASDDFGLIEPDDHIMVCVSGGKDSYTMLHLLRELSRHTPFQFRLTAVNLDQKQPNFPADVIPRYMAENGYDFMVVERDTYSVVTDKIPEGKTYCSLCSRLRRGILYDTAKKIGATKIALGHHRDDAIETMLLNILYSGQTKAMPPKLRSDDGANIVIRPLIYCAEKEIAELGARAADILPDSHGLTMLPFLAGERAPSWSDALAGTITGMTLDTSPAELLRAAMEATSYRFGAVYDSLAPLAAPVHHLIANGGALLQSPLWAQIIADTLGHPISALQSRAEASARGAAIGALHAAGHVPSLRTDPDIRRVFTPDSGNTATYSRGRARLESLERALTTWEQI